ncbi:hypothetical protein AWM79_20585 [Pseudomonas agarici]|uniref:Uncharacterized protein n=1 Tax=Pseudomonas agarici TaxID=46677 RepID=A0A0X1T659_PSEAA|nr:hypothetical protein [Pseudomonas agarici]AMB87560.1 hypothetical protein AWM79_20585 [Pseudomonas agarici]NWB90040.1 hypothetical protein [Pseudomonas agarici]NWC08182.1 hypothetical protein [Pseudomonas agarici]SEK84654.1 hypothetical protein SAMN05216604_107122 [Pseudomonas agarici]
MASSLLTSARHGAYIAISLYVAMVLLVSLSSLTDASSDMSLQMAAPVLQTEHKVQSVGAFEHGAESGV